MNKPSAILVAVSSVFASAAHSQTTKPIVHLPSVQVYQHTSEQKPNTIQASTCVNYDSINLIVAYNANVKKDNKGKEYILSCKINMSQDGILKPKSSHNIKLESPLYTSTHEQLSINTTKGIVRAIEPSAN